MPVVVVVPVKAFADAKARLAPVLDPHERARLARRLADTVVAAAAPLPVVVTCDHDDVRQWALDMGHEVDWTPGLGLNGAVNATVERLATRGIPRVIVAHADLPFARNLARLADGPAVTLVPDRHEDGTNVMSVPTDAGWTFRYGPGSFALHREEAARLGLEVRVLRDRALAWDIDHPEDLDAPVELGPVPWDRSQV